MTGRCADHPSAGRAARNNRAWQTQARTYYGQPCAYCGQPADTADHVTPVEHGGTNDPTNIVAACRSCNSKKRDQ